MQNGNHFTRKSIPVSKIDLDLNNSRFGKARDQKDALLKNLEANRTASGNKVLRLAKHIIENDLNPGDLIYLYSRDGKRYIDKEGNRRMTALKLLKNPNLIPTDIPEYKAFLALHKKIKKERIKLQDPFCVIFSKEEEVDKWVGIVHSGEKQGVGRASWGADEQRRHRERTGRKKDKYMILKDYLASSAFLSDEEKDAMADMSLTHLERILTGINARSRLGIEFQNDGSVFFTSPEEEVAGAFQQILFDFKLNPDVDARKKVKDIYNSDARDKYLDGIADSLPKTKIAPLKLVDDDNSDDEKKENAGSTGSGSFQQPNDGKEPKTEKFLIPKNFAVTINDPKVHSIVRELRSIELNRAPQAVAMLHRALLETALLAWLRRKGVWESEVLERKIFRSFKGGHKSPNLSDLLRELCKDDFDLLLMDGALRAAIAEFCAKDNPAGILNQMNYHVHNIYKFPSAAEIRGHWNSLRGLYDIILKEPTQPNEAQGTE